VSTLPFPPDDPSPPDAPAGASEADARIERLERRLAREREARKAAEGLLESKSRELYESNQALHALTRDLEQRVAERTAEVQRLMAAERSREEQQRHSQKMEALGLLAGGVAHDFNNLLTVIGGVTQLLQLEPALDPFRDLLDEVVEASRRAGALTAQLLAFSRRRSMEPQLFRAVDAVRDLQHLIRRLLTERIDLRIELEERVHVLMDRGGFDQIMLNLAANARDAMPDGGWFLVRTSSVTLSADVAHTLQIEPGEYLRLEASDCGTGMDGDVVQRAFDPFFTTKPLGKGSGLGLANVYAIVRQAGGHAAIESTLGQGTTVRFLLPAASPGVQLRSRTPVQAQRPQPDRRTVLVVDDEPGVRTVAALSLRKRGFEVLEASSGSQALDISRHPDAAFDVLLSDVRMPGMNGFDLAMTLRAERPSVSLVLMSGYVDDDQLRNRIDAAGIPLIEKPFRPAELAELITRRLTPIRPGTIIGESQ